MAKKSFGKNLLRLSSMLIAVIMLVTMMFTGVVSAEQEESITTEYAIKVAANLPDSNNAWIGQHVELKQGKQYVFSNCYTQDTFGHVVRKSGTWDTLSNDVTTYHNDAHRKITAFTVPVYDDNETVSMWVGIQSYKGSADVGYYYDLKLYDPTNPSVNLLADADLQAGGEGFDNVWTHASKALVAKYFNKVALADIGGKAIFQKTDADRHVVTLTPNMSGMPYLGQRVSLVPGKTYVYSNYYSKGIAPNQEILDANSNAIETEIIYDNNWSKQSVKFTVPEDTTVEADGKALIYVGFRGNKVSTPSYYYDLILYDVTLPGVNLLADPCLTGADFQVKADTWKTPSGNFINSSSTVKYYEVSLESIGGIDIFKKTDAERHVLKLTPNTKGQPFFGQRVLLVPGKTYEFSNYFLSNYPANPSICYPDTTAIDTEITIDKKYSKQTVKFTVPADAPVDENGKALIFVGFRGNLSETPLYYFDLKLNDVTNPELNLLADADLSGADFEVKADTWKTPGGNYINTAAGVKYTEVTLESIGGINAFLPYEVKCDLTGDGIVDLRDLVRMKRYSVGAVETLLEGAGDLDCDAEFAGSGDMVLLRKEILK